MFTHSLPRRLALHLALVGMIAGFAPPASDGEDVQSPSIMHKIQATNERLEMTVNRSRLLTLDLKIPAVPPGE